jgi:hypothetical protein
MLKRIFSLIKDLKFINQELKSRRGQFIFTKNKQINKEK